MWFSITLSTTRRWLIKKWHTISIGTFESISWVRALMIRLPVRNLLENLKNYIILNSREVNVLTLCWRNSSSNFFRAPNDVAHHGWQFHRQWHHAKWFCLNTNLILCILLPWKECACYRHCLAVPLDASHSAVTPIPSQIAQRVLYRDLSRHVINYPFQKFNAFFEILFSQRSRHTVLKTVWDHIVICSKFELQP